MLTACTSEPEQPEDNNSSESTAGSELLLHVPSPEWQDQVIYFLMTDRFNDGDPTNNDQGLGEFNPEKSSHFSGGDLQGVIDELDYIQDMGMTAVWTTPWVANQWWANGTNYGGYHGYWAMDFSSVDAHLGTMDTLKQLSDQLHRRDMYLVQDIVVNHTGNFFSYEGGQDGYDPNDTAKNFYLFEDESYTQSKPTQKPFDLIDRLNPEHVEANIYNWTPSIRDYSNVDHQYTYQLARLADINTTNPVVREKFKQIYSDWIKNVGVDAFRIDTVRYVENEFFHHFMHDADGIHAAAKSTGRDNFLAFGELFDTSKAYENDAEQRVAAYLGTEEKPELNSQISFPLHVELRTVFAQGFPTDHLRYRIEQHMAYPNPYVFPTFIDNHDMARFLSSGDVAGLKQALATIFTIPGIPTIYQGTAQAMTETRTAMFAEGYGAKGDVFDQTSELYQFIKTLANMRTSDKLFTRGEYQTIASDKNGPGIFAFSRSYQGRTVVVLMNTSPKAILANDIVVSNQAGVLNPIFGPEKALLVNASGKLTTELPPRVIVIAELEPIEATEQLSASSSINTTLENTVVTKDLAISGQVSDVSAPLVLVKNNRLDSAVTLTPNAEGYWQYTYEVNNLGTEQVSVVAYQPSLALASNALSFTTQLSEAQLTLELADPKDDDYGPNKQYLPPQHEQSQGQQDILGVKAELGGDILSLTLTMKSLTNDWIPANGFDNVAFSIYIDTADKEGVRLLPFLNADMANDWAWNIGHVTYGWGNSTFSPEGVGAENFGKKFGVAPLIQVDKDNKTINFRYNKQDFSVADWRGTKIYITTWDITGEGMYRGLTQDPSRWDFSGAEPNGAKILDSAEVIVE